jgi:hypothetical protein
MQKNNNNPGMDSCEALCIANDLKKDLLCKGIWCTITEIYEENLKFIKIEASIRVKQ